ncbi:MAG TPA: M24 family metallopeptidase [Ktedonobacteraceae bacterium]|nr:M24 family metallopeptidase [Ktedonobacteraceae bacterium]
MSIERIQQALREERVDGWLFYDFRRSNPIAYAVLELPLEAMYTRRWFYFVPAQGTPTAIVSAVESHVLRSLPGERRVYRTWQDMHTYLRELLLAGSRIAMEYSPMNAIPYIARVDAGTVELVRSSGVEVVTSANLSQRFVAQLSDAQIESQREAGRRIIAAKEALFVALGDDLRAEASLNEYDVQQRFLQLMRERGVVVEEPPIVAANANASNPHYLPTAERHLPIQRGDLILFDFWGTLPEPGSIYADYTWMAFAGTRDEIPAHQREVFDIVRRARDTAITFIRERLREGQPVEGREVDDVARSVIESAGYADYFVHRTGHSITTAEHGNGANIDNFETQDARLLLPNTCNSIEPGIYLPEFGVRSEVDLLISEHDVEVTGVPVQEEITALL